MIKILIELKFRFSYKYIYICVADSGILLSNSVIKKLKHNLDWCVKNIYSDIDDVNFGLCIMHSTSLRCLNTFNDNSFISTNLNASFDIKNDFTKLAKTKDFLDSISVYPIKDHSMIHKLNAYFTSVCFQLHKFYFKYLMILKNKI